MTNVAIIGTQWGDEGKGKVVDALAHTFDLVVRFQGGHNAGHTVVFNDERFALHVLPSGIFQKNTVNLVGNGVVVDPFSLLKEIDGLTKRGIAITPDNLKISDRAHLILPYHGIVDRYRDSGGGMHIGTTGRGIGPAYEWKAARRGIRFCDLAHRDNLRDMLAQQLSLLNQHYGDVDGLSEMTIDTLWRDLEPALDRLEPHVADGVALLAEARQQNKRILFEGAQAVLLDVDFGTYPYVTSSNSCAVGISAGAGVPPRTVQHIIGVCKAYTTRVGAGPFPTELDGEVAENLRDAGHEFGTTTGRPRRCGWLDLVALKYAHRLNGFDAIALMKMDVLDKMAEIGVCTTYRVDGQATDCFPASPIDLERAEPVYHYLPGWQTSLTECRTWDDLPKAAHDYINYIAEFIGCPVGLISVGPDRQQTIMTDHLRP